MSWSRFGASARPAAGRASSRVANNRRRGMAGSPRVTRGVPGQHRKGGATENKGRRPPGSKETPTLTGGESPSPRRESERPMVSRFVPTALALLLVTAAGARAELRSLEVLSREPFAGGMAFGDTGPYEKVV